ncbi:MAG TPA: SUF system NifU family Fe-S cluster assembly protein [Acidimicrobiales bacterium]|nr:MAG: SUF system NifU family Fe-S cluster assembly protein [Actinobacteria bacterium 21-64-8]HQU00318.1 SUF system NifU family Fe-S cluster assembly protein [Acidimicrobiales bacterium]
MSNLDDLYREIILDHYRSPRNRGQLVSPPAHRVEGFNPLCGDEITIDLLVEGDAVVDLKLSGHGCSISQASSSLMSVAVKGKSLDEVRHAITEFKSMMLRHETSLSDEESTSQIARLRELGEIAALAGVVKFPVRIKCATLAWNTLSQGLDELA